MDPIEAEYAVSRRKLLLASAGAAAGVVTLAACGGSDTGATKSATGGASDGSAKALATLADVPLGGAVAAQGPDGRPVIVSQPTKGNVVAFSAICTHMGCTVAPHGSILQCPCHGSTYDLATGKNTGGPAPKPLAKLSVKVSKGKVVET
jgi:Rieske Fe-S protein